MNLRVKMNKKRGAVTAKNVKILSKIILQKKAIGAILIFGPEPKVSGFLQKSIVKKITTLNRVN